MNKIKTILIDLWGTIVESKERDDLLKKVLKSFEYSGINKSDFLKYWKEKWFKSRIGGGEFIEKLRKKFHIGDYEVMALKKILDYGNLSIIDGRLNSLLRLRDLNYKIHLVSDCGGDFKKFVENSDLNKVLSKRFYSFEYGTTKDEDLYGHVSEEIGLNCLVIGDDYYRDYKIPKKYGFRAKLIKKLDKLEDVIWND